VSTAVNTLVTRVRELVPEATAIEWTDPRIVIIMDRVYKKWCAALGLLPGPGWFTIVTDFSIAANATTKDLSSVLAAEVGEIAALKTLWYCPDAGKRTRVPSAAPGQEEEYVLGVGESPVGQQAPLARWLTRPAGVLTLNVGPESNVSRTFRAYLRYEPPTLASGATLQTDTRHDDIMVIGTALRMLQEVQEDDPTLRAIHQDDWTTFLDHERNVAGEHESETTKVVVGYDAE